MISLDEHDLAILRVLQNNAKATITEISEQCHLTRTPIFERIRKMEEGGVIQSYRAQIDPESVGFSLHAFCNVSLKEHAASFLGNFEKRILELPEVTACYHTAGMFDYLLEIRVVDMDAYRNFISSQLAGIDNIGNVQSFFIMKDLKTGSELPLHLSDQFR